MDSNKVLECETRKEVYDHICLNPGIHFKDLSIAVNISKGALSFHLKKLTESGLIEERHVSKYRQLFPKGYSIKNYLLLNKNEKQLYETLKVLGNATQKEIIQASNIPQPTASRLLNGMANRNILLKEVHPIEDFKHIILYSIKD